MFSVADYKKIYKGFCSPILTTIDSQMLYCTRQIGWIQHCESLAIVSTSPELLALAQKIKKCCEQQMLDNLELAQALATDWRFLSTFSDETVLSPLQREGFEAFLAIAIRHQPLINATRAHRTHFLQMGREFERKATEYIALIQQQSLEN